MRTSALRYVSICGKLRTGCRAQRARFVVLLLAALGMSCPMPAAYAGDLAAAALPAAGIVGLCIVAVVCIIAGAFILMRKDD